MPSANSWFAQLSACAATDFTARRLCLDIKWVQDLGLHFDECHFQERKPEANLP